MGFLSNVRNYVFPTPGNPISGMANTYDNASNATRDLRRYITPVQLQRVRHDVAMWRQAVNEAELAWYPHRVRMQRMFIDTIIHPHILACVERRKDLTLLREFSFKNNKGVENEELKKMFNKPWFKKLMNYALDAIFHGYTLVALGDVKSDDFPELDIIRRFNISPDRLNVTSYVYSLSGAEFMKDPYAPYHVWIPTPTDVGISKVGYGLLYNVAILEIFMRNGVAVNADALELFSMPIRKGTTTKTEERERKEYEQALANMGSAGYILMDPADELELVESKSMGQAFKIFPDFEKRMQQLSSKVILGHADVLDSVPGKIGSQQGNKDNPQAKALAAKQAKDGDFVEDVINNNLIPKLINLGFNIDTEFKFCFGNNEELAEIRKSEDEQNKATADIAVSMSQAGLKMDAKYFEERTGIPTTEVVELPAEKFPPLKETISNRLKKIYNKNGKTHTHV